VIDLLMLLCAVLASLAAGVLAAYGVCVGMFGLFPDARSPGACEAQR